MGFSGNTPINNAITESGTLTGALGNVGESLVNSAIGALSPFNNFGRYLTGSRAIIKINDNLFGFAFGVTFNIQTMVEEINTIDDWTPYELAPSRIAVNGTLSMFHIPGKSPTRELVQANVLSFLFHKYVTISISDQTTGQKIFETRKAFITGRRQSVNAGELSSMTLEWKAIGFIDDMTPAYPENYDKVDLSSLSAGGFTGILDPSTIKFK
jgi:hypothetical protein